MKAHKIVQGHYTVQVDGATYDIKRKSYRVGKGTFIYRWHIYQGETHIGEGVTLYHAKEILSARALPDFVPVQAQPDWVGAEPTVHYCI
jgi:hypothetical protein